MNFKFIFLFILLLNLCSCGLKNDPIAPKDSYLPSLLDNYPDIKTDAPLNETPRR